MSAAKEIERKFLVKRLPAEIKSARMSRIRQGYLAAGGDGSEARLRRKDDKFFLTVKAGSGLVRREAEVELAPAQFARLWPLTKGRRLRKRRYSLAHGKLEIEIDVYRGSNAGLTVAEIEFPDRRAAERFKPPEWLGREITGDGEYANVRLATE